MEDLIQVAGPAEVRSEGRSRRAFALVAVLALVVGGLVLARHATPPVSTDKIVNVKDSSTPADGVGGALGRSLGFGAAPQAQINIPALVSSIVCPILNRLAASISFLGPVLQPVRVLFGCISI